MTRVVLSANRVTDEKLYRDSIWLKKSVKKKMLNITQKTMRKISHYDFVLIDLLDTIGYDTTPVIEIIKDQYPKIEHRR